MKQLDLFDASREETDERRQSVNQYNRALDRRIHDGHARNHGHLPCPCDSCNGIRSGHIRKRTHKTFKGDMVGFVRMHKERLARLLNRLNRDSKYGTVFYLDQD